MLFLDSYSLIHRLNEEASSNLEVSLKAKEKIISELHYELHTIESTLSNEREQHLVEVKRLNALLNEKVREASLFVFTLDLVFIHSVLCEIVIPVIVKHLIEKIR